MYTIFTELLINIIMYINKSKHFLGFVIVSFILVFVQLMEHNITIYLSTFSAMTNRKLMRLN